jgi:hypothetical protein
MIQRLLDALTSLGVAKYGRNVAISEKTGYSKGSVAGIMSGQKPINARFIRAVCSAFGISREWIEEGKEPVFVDARPMMLSDVPKDRRDEFKNLFVELDMQGVSAIRAAIDVQGPVVVDLVREITGLDRDRAYDLFFQLQKVNREHWQFDDRYDNIAHEQKVKRGIARPRRLTISQIEES